MKRTDRRKVAAAAAGIAVFASAAGTTGAYLIYSPEALENIITPGSIEVEVTEPDWVPELGRQMVPGSVIPKDPTVANTGKNDAWIFAKVQVPARSISLVSEATKRKQTAAWTELFTFETNNGWELVEQSVLEDGICYVYGYGDIVKPGEETIALFENVTLVNYLEGELDETDEIFMPIEAMAIQTKVCADGAGLKEIYQQYLNQKNSEQ